MTLVLYGHPFSSYSQKALIALYENATPFEFKVLGPSTPENFEALKKLWPMRHHYSMQIGRIRSRTSFPNCGLTETACWLARHLRVP
jgi:hypothetical protein